MQFLKVFLYLIEFSLKVHTKSYKHNNSKLEIFKKIKIDKQFVFDVSKVNLFQMIVLNSFYFE